MKASGTSCACLGPAHRDHEPRAHDGLTLFSQPLLLPFAWVVMGTSYIVILLGVLYLRSKVGGWIKTRRG